MVALNPLTREELEAENERLRAALAAAGIDAQQAAAVHAARDSRHRHDLADSRAETAHAHQETQDTQTVARATAKAHQRNLSWSKAALAASQTQVAGLQTDRAALIRSEARQRAIFDSAIDFAVVVIDPDGIVTDWNPGAERVMGWTDTEMLGQPTDRFFTPEDRAAGHIAFEMQQAVATGRASDERWHLKKGGERYFASGEMMPLYDDDREHLGFVKILRDRTEQHEAGRLLAESEERYRTLFNAIDEGFCVVRFIDGPHGPLSDYLHVEANPAYERHTGIAGIVGQTIRGLAPDEADGWVAIYGEVLRTGRPVRFEREFVVAGGFIEVVAHRVEPASRHEVAILFNNITARVLADRAQQQDGVHNAALFELSEGLRQGGDARTIALIGAGAIGRVLKVSQVGYGIVAADDLTLIVEQDWTAPGYPSQVGCYRLDEFVGYIEDLRQGRNVAISDVRLDPRTAPTTAALEGAGVRALLNMPLVEDGRLRAVLYINTDTPRVWNDAEVVFARQVAELVRQAVERRRAEEQQAVLNRELSHRMKNTLAIVQAITTQTLRNASDLTTAREALGARLIALGKAHDILLTGRGESADMRAVIEGALELHDDEQQGHFTLKGPVLHVGESAALSLSLMIHELATNAAKYGALSGPGGHVEIAWTIGGSAGQETVQLVWQEHGGPPVTPPTRKGFGSRLIERGFAGAVSGRTETAYPPEGVICTMTAPLTAFHLGR